MKLLFVDDELNVLNGLKRMLHSHRSEWDMYFVDDAEKAINLLEGNEIDLLITDMKMPGKDGLFLLDYVDKHFPQVVRIILTGHTDEEYIIKSVKISHQYILKPCTHDELVNRITKIMKLKRYLVSPELKNVIASVKHIPVLPETYIRFEKELNSENPSLNKLCEIIEKEPGLSAKILQLVNSAYFQLQNHIGDIQQALNILGLNSLRSIVLSAEIFDKSSKLNTTAFTLKQLWEHSTHIANLSQSIFEIVTGDKFLSKHAYLSGLLHDIGYLLITQLSNYDEKVSVHVDENTERWEAELRWLEITHAEIGAYLLSVWNLPEPVIQAVAKHHRGISDFSNPSFEEVIYAAHLWEKGADAFRDYMSKVIDNETIARIIDELTKLDEKILV